VKYAIWKDRDPGITPDGHRITVNLSPNWSAFDCSIDNNNSTVGEESSYFASQFSGEKDYHNHPSTAPI
jgi:hypothetical protein